MATKKTPKTSDLSTELPGNEAELDQAIDDLRGVLKTDADGGLPDFAGESDAFSGSTDLSTFGGDFEDTAGDSAFGGSDFGATSDFGGSSDFGDSSFGAIASEPAPLGSAMQSNLDLIMDIPIDVQIMLGSSRMQVAGLMNLNEGATIALDKKIGEPVEIMVNGRKIARGEITVLDNDDTRFGVKLIEVLSTKKA
ncbi:MULTISPECIES: flagellar motor switch protein FliN [unclassified Rhizobium]|uniref:flagellar motor switch protein FliN n=1 Tax=unclassified Rhizobium TaxID=2613769 RepID=UPI001608B286|nr:MULTISPECIES: flagellar motor switch protein FliN [unclassified Rhizobium]MBB3540240.1 flagellar motor switch protein FliN/FliY [Rhizobium sp. BK399]MCS3738749.1 flagellar motor switch protein FliN/FliY [Rhizobium sp. BK661]MCS4090925.1 flagellar motor switch protein FliN/FliY [Rhizobium sp. BK176]